MNKACKISIHTTDFNNKPVYFMSTKWGRWSAEQIDAMWSNYIGKFTLSEGHRAKLKPPMDYQTQLCYMYVIHLEAVTAIV